MSSIIDIAIIDYKVILNVIIQTLCGIKKKETCYRIIIPQYY